MWQTFWNCFYPTPELQAAMKLPFGGARFKAVWKASWRWPVLWRWAVAIFVGLLLCNVGYLAVRGFQTVALEHQERARAAYALEQAAQVARTAQPGSGQYEQVRQDIMKALDRLRVSANKPALQFFAEVTHIQVNPFAQFAADAGLGELCEQLRLSLSEHADAATQRLRLNVHSLYCVLSADEVAKIGFADGKQ